jgi:hypothetical protein
MKRKVLFGVAAWVVLVTLAHLHVNVGWAGAAATIREMLGAPATLQVGFLPVT